MPDARIDTVNCEEVRRRIAQREALLSTESAHVEGCAECLEIWLDMTVVQALDTKPEVRIPADFAARVAAGLPQKPTPSGSPRREERTGGRHWGLTTAILLVAAGLVAAAVSDPTGWNSRMGLVFVAIVVSEIAGIALWLGIEGRS